MLPNIIIYYLGKFTHIIILLITCLQLISCNKIPNNDELIRLDHEINDMVKHNCHSNTDSLSTLLLRRAEEASNLLYEGKAHLYLSHYTPDVDSAEVKSKLQHIDAAERIAIETRNDTLLSWLYNQRGVWEMAYFMHPETARYWFNRSIETATTLGKRWIILNAEMNLSESSRLMGDTLGIQYDRDLFNYAVEQNVQSAIFSSAVRCGLYYARTSADSTKMNPYINAIRNLGEVSAGIPEMIYATWHYNQGQFSKALWYMELSNPYRYGDFVVLYADILNKLGRYSDSENSLARLDTTDTNLYDDAYMKMLRIRSSNQAALGEWEAACGNLSELVSMHDEKDKSKSLDISKMYTVAYEVNIKDREILEERQKARNSKLILYCTSSFLLFIFIGAMIYFHKRNIYYRNIVRQNLKYAEIIKKSRNSPISILLNETYESPLISENEKTSQSTNSDVLEKIFVKIRYYIEEKQMWRNTDLSRENLSEIVGCNRTYLTEAIKRNTGMSYTQYINSFRLAEAKIILTDVSDTTPMKELASKLGFISVSGFYACFRKDTGMSPSAFRETAHKLICK